MSAHFYSVGSRENDGQNVELKVKGFVSGMKVDIWEKPSSLKSWSSGQGQLIS